MLLYQIVKEIVPNADEAMTKNEISKMIQEISEKRKLLNGDWVRAAVTPKNKAQ